MSISFIKNWLQQPFYVWEYNLKRKWFLVGGIVIFSVLFKIVYYPGFSSQPIEKNLAFNLAHTLTNFFVLVFMLIILPRLFNHYFDDENRTIKKEIFWFALLFALLTISHAIVIVIENSVIPISKSLKDSFYINLSIGIFPIIIMLFLAYIRSLELKLKDLYLYNADEFVKPNAEGSKIVTLGQGDGQLKLNCDQLVYVKSSNNYCEVYYRADNILLKNLVRIPISELENIINCDFICRIHRGYIVNFLEISKVLGNANKCSVKLKHIEGKLPVSRTKRSEILMKLKNLPTKIVA